MPTYEIADLTTNVDFECHVDGKIEKPLVQYRAKVEFDTLDRVLEYAGESVTRTLQTYARRGKMATGERVVVKVGERVEFAKPVTKADVDRLSDDEAEAMMKLLEARMAAKMAAATKLAEDEPKTQKVKGKN